MVTVQGYARELAIGIADGDSRRIEELARASTDIWLAGRSAYRRLLETSKIVSPYMDAARILLEENYMTLLGLFSRAARAMEGPGLRKVIHELRGTLTAAMAVPLLDESRPRSGKHARKE
jgi:hypothetical protein